MTESEEGWDMFDPNDNERTGQPEYEAARAKARERREYQAHGKLIEDYVIFKVPHDADPDQPEQRKRMNMNAEAQVLGQYKRLPKVLLIDPIDWLVTSDWQEVERFQPAHDCATCQAANDQAVAFLKEHPEERLALGNLRYREIW